MGAALAHIGIGGRKSSRSRESSEKQRLRSGSGAEAVTEEVVGPSICPSIPFHTFVSAVLLREVEGSTIQQSGGPG